VAVVPAGGRCSKEGMFPCVSGCRLGKAVPPQLDGHACYTVCMVAETGVNRDSKLPPLSYEGGSLGICPRLVST
jgi:hypothetical protein